MVTRLLSVLLVCSSSLVAHAGIIYSNFTGSNTGITGLVRYGSIVDFGTPDQYDLESVDAKLYFSTSTHQNVEVKIRLFATVDLGNMTSVFQNEVYSALYNLGSVTVTTGTNIRVTNFDLNNVFTGQMGIEFQLFKNGSLSGSGIGLAVNPSGNTTLIDDDDNGVFSSAEYGLIPNSNQIQLNGISLTAVPEPSSLFLLSLFGALPLCVKRRPSNHVDT